MRLSEPLPALAPRPLGGLAGGVIWGRESMLFLIGRRGGSARACAAAAEIGCIEVGLLSLRVAGGIQGVGRGKIVDCGGDLARFRLDEWGIVWGIAIMQKKRTHDYS